MTENQQMQPTSQHIAALRRMEKREAGTDAYVNRDDAEECVYYGWAEAQRDRTYRLTDKGRAILAAADSN